MKRKAPKKGEMWTPIHEKDFDYFVYVYKVTSRFVYIVITDPVLESGMVRSEITLTDFLECFRYSH